MNQPTQGKPTERVAQRGTAGPGARPRFALAAGIGFVVIAGVVAVALSGKDRNNDSSSVSTVAERASSDTAQLKGSTLPAPTVGSDVDAETHPVQIVGSPLGELSDGVDGAVGTAAPVLTGTTFAGKSITTAPAGGHRRLVVFLAHWCPHCQREVPRIVKWAAEGHIPKDLDVMAVATATTPERPNYPPSKWLAREKWPFPVLVDDAKGSAGASYGLSGFPFLALLDDQGKIVARTSGEKELSELDAFVRSPAATGQAT
jgi:cytochrome c biogenesis protein CcmG, thiol:disulfide interchange protein DsbE